MRAREPKRARHSPLDPVDSVPQKEFLSSYLTRGTHESMNATNVSCDAKRNQSEWASRHRGFCLSSLKVTSLLAPKESGGCDFDHKSYDKEAKAPQDETLSNACTTTL